MKLPLAKIRTDGGTQTRVKLDPEQVEAYRDAMVGGAEFPSVVVFHDAEGFWLADGFHRLEAARLAGIETLEVDVNRGSRRDAILYSVGANTTHGLRRTNADKRRAVVTLLADEEWAKKSDRWIAETCRVGNHLVAEMRSAGGGSPTSSAAKRTGKDGKAQPAKKPRAKPAKPAAPARAEPAPASGEEPRPAAAPRAAPEPEPEDEPEADLDEEEDEDEGDAPEPDWIVDPAERRRRVDAIEVDLLRLLTDWPHDASHDRVRAMLVRFIGFIDQRESGKVAHG